MVKDGRIDHARGGHDDQVVSYLLAAWYLLYGKRLKWYGLTGQQNFHKLIDMKKRGVETHDELKHEKIQEGLMDEINAICQEIAANSNPFLKTKLERRLKIRLGALDLDTTSATTTNDLQKIIKQQKLQGKYR